MNRFGSLSMSAPSPSDEATHVAAHRINTASRARAIATLAGGASEFPLLTAALGRLRTRLISKGLAPARPLLAYTASAVEEASIVYENQLTGLRILQLSATRSRGFGGYPGARCRGVSHRLDVRSSGGQGP